MHENPIPSTHVSFFAPIPRCTLPTLVLIPCRDDFLLPPATCTSTPSIQPYQRAGTTADVAGPGPGVGGAKKAGAGAPVWPPPESFGADGTGADRDVEVDVDSGGRGPTPASQKGGRGGQARGGVAAPPAPTDDPNANPFLSQ